MSKYDFSILLRNILNSKSKPQKKGEETEIVLPVVCAEEWSPIFETNELFNAIQEKIKKRFRNKYNEYNGIQSRRVVYKVNEEKEPLYLMITEYKLKKFCKWIPYKNSLGEARYKFEDDKENYFLKPDFNFVVKNGTGLGLGDYKVVF